MCLLGCGLPRNFYKYHGLPSHQYWAIWYHWRCSYTSWGCCSRVASILGYNLLPWVGAELLWDLIFGRDAKFSGGMLEFHDTRISYMPGTTDWRHSLGHVVHLAQRFRSRFVERQILVQLQLRRYQARRCVGNQVAGSLWRRQRMPGILMGSPLTI